MGRAPRRADVRYLDQSGVYMLADWIDDLHRGKTLVLIAELQPEPAEILASLGVAPGAVPPDRIFTHVQDAIATATRQSHSDGDKAGSVVA